MFILDFLSSKFWVSSSKLNPYDLFSLFLWSCFLAISLGCLSGTRALPSPHPSAVITSQATSFSSPRRLLRSSCQALPPGPSYPLPITQSFHERFSILPVKFTSLHSHFREL